MLQEVFVTEPDDQSLVYKKLLQCMLSSVCKNKQVVARQIVTASRQQCTFSQCHWNPAVSGQEEHPPYLPDLAQCDIFLFLGFKRIIKGTHFEGMEIIERAIMTKQKGNLENHSSNAWKYGRERWENVLNSSGESTLKKKPCSLLFGIEMNCL